MSGEAYTAAGLADVPRVDVAAAAIVPALVGALRLPHNACDTGDGWPGLAVLRCEGVDVALMQRRGQTDALEVLAVPCAHPSHGTHPRFAAAAERLRAILGGRFGTPADRACTICGGGAWLAAHSAEAHYQIMLAQCLGAWRGVALPPPAGAEGQTDGTEP